MSISERDPLESVDWAPPHGRPLRREISIAEMTFEQCAEVAALFAETREFATVTRAWTAEQLRAACAAGEQECLVVQLSSAGESRGLVGAMLFSIGGDALRLDAFALAEAARGWVVEEQMLALVGAIARLRGLPRVEVALTPSATNHAACEFFTSLAGQAAAESAPAEEGPAPLATRRFHLPAERLTRLSTARRAPAANRPTRPR